MLSRTKELILTTPVLYAVAILLGTVSGFMGQEALFEVATYISDAFMNLLKLVSVPILFLSIVTVASGMENMRDMAIMGKKVVKYTLITTILAATVALVLFLLIDPVQGSTITHASQSAEIVKA